MEKGYGEERRWRKETREIREAWMENRVGSLSKILSFPSGGPPKRVVGSFRISLRCYCTCRDGNYKIAIQSLENP